MLLEGFCFSLSFSDTGVPCRAMRDCRNSVAMGGVLNIHGATSAHRTAQPIRLEKSITESNLWPNTAMALSATPNISRDGDSNTFLGSPFQHLITLPVGSITPKFPLMSIPNHLGCLCPHQSMARGSAPILGCLGCWTSKQLVAYA